MQKRHFSVKGIILQKVNYQDSDRIYTVYTDILGKISILGKGVRKIKSRTTGHLELFQTSSFELYKSTSSNLYKLNSAENLVVNANYALNLELMEKGFAILKKINQFTEENHPLIRIFALLEKTLVFLNQEKNITTLEQAFNLKLFTILGFLPKFNTCLICHQKLSKNSHYFNLKNRGLNCSACASEKISIEKINFETIKILNFLQQGQLEEIAKLKLKPENLQELKKITERIGAQIQTG